MLGKTHFTLGMASALAITQPTTIPGVIAAMTGGAIGGWIVDIDCKSMDEDKEAILDTIIDLLFIGAFIAVDYFIGKGMCQYIIDNWGIKIWLSLITLILLMIIGNRTKHRTFTHSFLGLVLFSTSILFLCRPATIPFAIGYSSHLVADFFNKLGLQLFFPLKWRPCLKLCKSNKKANKILFWISLALSIILGSFFFSRSLMHVGMDSDFLMKLTARKVLGLNSLQLYLIFINIVTFLGFQRNFRNFLSNIFDAYEQGKVYNDKDYETPESNFEIWFLDFLAFIGGGIGMMLSLLIHAEIPRGYNANWWAFCYTSVMFWSTIYCYICNPFNYIVTDIIWRSTKHIPVLLYLLIINLITILYLLIISKKKFDEYDFRHTALFLLGALGGTIGAIPMVFIIKRSGKYFYVTMGFFIMLISQIVFSMYMMMIGIF